MSTNYTAVGIAELEAIFAALVAKTGFNNEDLALIEPYNGPRPDQAYATIRLASCQSLDHPAATYEQEENGEYKQRFKGTSWCRIEIRFFGDNAFAKAVVVREAFFAQERLFDLLPKVGLGEVGEVEDCSEVYQGQTERRARFHVDFYANLASERDALSISRVKANLQADSGTAPLEVAT